MKQEINKYKNYKLNNNLDYNDSQIIPLEKKVFFFF